MTKEEFLKRWCKKATGGGAAEAFEVDLEKLSRSLIRSATSAIVNGLIVGTAKLSKRDREVFQKVIREVPLFVEQALAKLYE